MEYKFKLIECNDNDVFSFPGDVTLKVGKFRQEVHKAFGQSVGAKFTDELISQNINIDPYKLHPDGYWETVKAWFNEGIDCEVLNLGSETWKKGKVKVKVSIEFFIEEDIENINGENSIIPEPESPLDDLRRTIYEENS